MLAQIHGPRRCVRTGLQVGEFVGADKDRIVSVHIVPGRLDDVSLAVQRIFQVGGRRGWNGSVNPGNACDKLAAAGQAGGYPDRELTGKEIDREILTVLLIGIVVSRCDLGIGSKACPSS